MAYKVINRFKEMKHDGHVYEVGDTYPVEGHKLVKARAEFLTKVHDTYGVAFLVAEETVEVDKKEAGKASKVEAAEGDK